MAGKKEWNVFYRFFYLVLGISSIVHRCRWYPCSAKARCIHNECVVFCVCECGLQRIVRPCVDGWSTRGNGQDTFAPLCRFPVQTHRSVNHFCVWVPCTELTVCVCVCASGNFVPANDGQASLPTFSPSTDANALLFSCNNNKCMKMWKFITLNYYRFFSGDSFFLSLLPAAVCGAAA